MPPRVRVYVAASLDGFIAGQDDDLSWLPGADPSSADGDRDPAAQAPPLDGTHDAVSFDRFIGEVGALLMGRRTYDVVNKLPIAWPYGDRPVLVATHRPLEAAPETVRAVSGDISELVALARGESGTRDVYLDGGAMIRQALDAGLVDELIVTVVPQLLGAGRPLFAGVTRRQPLRIISHIRFAGELLQLRLEPNEPPHP